MSPLEQLRSAFQAATAPPPEWTVGDGSLATEDLASKTYPFIAWHVRAGEDSEAPVIDQVQMDGFNTVPGANQPTLIGRHLREDFPAHLKRTFRTGCFEFYYSTREAAMKELERVQFEIARPKAISEFNRLAMECMPAMIGLVDLVCKTPNLAPPFAKLIEQLVDDQAQPTARRSPRP